MQPQPDHADRHLWLRAQRHASVRRWDDAIADFHILIERHPSLYQARLLLAGVLLATNRVQSAARQLLLAAAHLPDDAGAIQQVAQALAKVGESVAAVECLRHRAVRDSRSASALLAIAHVFQGLGLHQDALALMDRARGLGLDDADFRYFRALQLQFNGRLDEAEREMEACLGMGPTFGRASLSLARIRRQTPDANHLDMIRERLAVAESGSEDHASLEFALHKELEDLGDHHGAWDALARANKVMRERLPYDMGAEDELAAHLMRTLGVGIDEPVEPSAPGPVPIFVVGMPRSGTTLLESILGRHSMIAASGELADFPRQLRWAADIHGHALLDEALLSATARLDFRLLGQRYLEQTQWRAGGRAYYVDKLPPNFMLVGHIRRALPQARIVHLVRDPMDLCFSNFRAMFGDAYAYSYDLQRLAHHHGLYLRLMRHWHRTLPGAIHDVSYADLVTDTETTCRRLLQACGIPFEPQCLQQRRDSGAVATLSSAQVRQPIHARGIGEWRRYERQLQPLQALLQRNSV